MQKLLWVKLNKLSKEKIETQKNILATKEDVLTTKLDLIDRINKAKIETILWIVGIGVLQFILSILSKKFL